MHTACHHHFLTIYFDSDLKAPKNNIFNPYTLEMKEYKTQVNWFSQGHTKKNFKQINRIME